MYNIEAGNIPYDTMTHSNKQNKFDFEIIEVLNIIHVHKHEHKLPRLAALTILKQVVDCLNNIPVNQSTYISNKRFSRNNKSIYTIVCLSPPSSDDTIIVQIISRTCQKQG